MAYQAVNWSPNEVLGETKMDQVSKNIQYLYNHTPQALYTNSGLSRAQGVKIAAGRVMIPAKKTSDNATVAVRFGNFFSARCEPIITTGIVADHQVRIFCVINGIGGRLQPDHTGFNVAINIAAEKDKNDHIAKSFFVAWQAMGY